MINNIINGHGRTIDVGRHENSITQKTPNVSQSVDQHSVSGALSGAIEHMVQQGMPIDLQRIVAVRNAIADGQYPVDPAKIAEKIMDFERSVGEFS